MKKMLLLCLHGAAVLDIYLTTDSVMLLLSGGTRRSWKRRYFILADNKLEYFKTKGAKKVKGSIILSEGKGVREKHQCECVWPPFVHMDNCFGLATKSRTYYLYTTTAEGNIW
jgi:hypothetical protein